MAIIKPFKGIRPPQDLVGQIVFRPCGVLNSEEAHTETVGNKKSPYHIIGPEIDFPTDTDEHDEHVCEKVAENFRLFQDRGWLVQDAKENYRIYAQTMNGKTQCGPIVDTYVLNYVDGIVKKHELTRRDKEEDRMRHARVNSANIEPVLFTYSDSVKLDTITRKYTAEKSVYDLAASGDDFEHTFWIADRDEDIAAITAEFTRTPALYIADGYHRSTAVALVGAEKAGQNASHRDDEEYNYFIAVCFPTNRLTIADYNRVVKDLSGLTPKQFLAALDKNFVVEEKSTDIYKPSGLHNFSLYLSDKWYSLTAKADTCNDDDPIDVLDVIISSNLILDETLGIKDLRSDKRTDFVDGIRGLGELKKRVDNGEMKVALALYSVSMRQLMDITDTSNIMPPKAIWFEPRLRSGLVIHKSD